MNIDEMRKHKWTISWSGGKDSTATIILCHKYNIPIKRIVHVRLMYNDIIPATLPCVVEFVDYAKNIFQKWGYFVEILPGIKTAEELANKVYTKSIYEYKNGKPYGMRMFCRKACAFTTIKIETIKKAYQGKIGYEMIGYAYNEQSRLIRLTHKQQSILNTLRIDEDKALEICKEYNLLSPLYSKDFKRDGCWFCPSMRKSERIYLKQNYPQLVNEIIHLIEMCNYDLSSLAPINSWIKDYYDGNL